MPNKETKEGIGAATAVAAPAVAGAAIGFCAYKGGKALLRKWQRNK